MTDLHRTPDAPHAKTASPVGAGDAPKVLNQSHWRAAEELLEGLREGRSVMVVASEPCAGAAEAVAEAIAGLPKRVRVVRSGPQAATLEEVIAPLDAALGGLLSFRPETSEPSERVRAAIESLANSDEGVAYFLTPEEALTEDALVYLARLAAGGRRLTRDRLAAREAAGAALRGPVGAQVVICAPPEALPALAGLGDSALRRAAEDPIEVRLFDAPAIRAAYRQLSGAVLSPGAAEYAQAATGGAQRHVTALLTHPILLRAEAGATDETFTATAQMVARAVADLGLPAPEEMDPTALDAADIRAEARRGATGRAAEAAETKKAATRESVRSAQAEASEAAEAATEEAAVKQPAVKQPAVKQPDIEEPAVQEAAVEEARLQEAGAEAAETERFEAEEVVETAEATAEESFADVGAALETAKTEAVEIETEEVEAEEAEPAYLEPAPELLAQKVAAWEDPSEERPAQDDSGQDSFDQDPSGQESPAQEPLVQEPPVQEPPIQEVLMGETALEETAPQQTPTPQIDEQAAQEALDEALIEAILEEDLSGDDAFQDPHAAAADDEAPLEDLQGALEAARESLQADAGPPEDDAETAPSGAVSRMLAALGLKRKTSAAERLRIEAGRPSQTLGAARRGVRIAAAFVVGAVALGAAASFISHGLDDAAYRSASHQGGNTRFETGDVPGAPKAEAEDATLLSALVGGALGAAESAARAAADSVAPTEGAAQGLSRFADDLFTARGDIDRGRMADQLAALPPSKAKARMDSFLIEALRRAEAHAAAGRYTAPEGANAYEVLLRIYPLSPTDARVRGALSALVRHYDEQAAQALKEQRYQAFHQHNRIADRIRARKPII